MSHEPDPNYHSIRVKREDGGEEAWVVVCRKCGRLMRPDCLGEECPGDAEAKEKLA